MEKQGNFQKQGKNLRDKNLEKFYKLTEDNLLSWLLMRNAKIELDKAVKSENKVMMMIHSEEIEAHSSLYAKNVYELTILMEILGFNEIKYQFN